MTDLNYTFEFNDVRNSPTFVKVINHAQKSETSVAVSIGYDDLFRHVAPGGNLEAAMDGLTLAAVIYVCDWLAKRHRQDVRRIRIVAPLWRPEIFETPLLQRQLQRTLSYVTGDNWYFEWKKRQYSVVPGAQIPFAFDMAPEVCLWSGGLDAASGLMNRARQKSAEHYVLIGSGASDSIIGVQKHVHSIASHLTDSKSELLQIPLSLLYGSELQKESSQRSRGFVFTLIGSVGAYLRGQKTLNVYENGIGAINLPYCSAEIGLDHARSVHPSSLWEISQLASLILEGNVQIHNPFIFSTKAEMCSELRNLTLDKLKDYIKATHSCDSHHRQKDRPSQCGYCSSCLLRRQALAFSDIHDETKYALFSKPIRSEDSHPLRAMIHQVSNLEECLEQSAPWAALSAQFPELIEVMSPTILRLTGSELAIREEIISLYKRYCHEWRFVETRIAKGLTQQLLAA